jgi:hypothetical protein
MVSCVQNKNLSYTFALIFLVFIFLFPLFQVELDHHHMWSSPSLECQHALYLGCTNRAHVTPHAKVSARFHQLSQTKQGLSPILVKQCHKVFCFGICVFQHLGVCLCSAPIILISDRWNALFYHFDIICAWSWQLSIIVHATFEVF